MILIIGGFAAGKRDYVRSLGYQDQDFTREIGDGKPVLWGLQDLVYQNPEEAMELLPGLLEKQAVICDEVGCGVTPVDAWLGSRPAVCAPPWPPRLKRSSGCAAAFPPS